MTRHVLWIVGACLALACGDSFSSSETSTGGSNPGGTGGTTSGTGGTTSGTGGNTTGGGGTGGEGGEGGTTVGPCMASNSIDNLVDDFEDGQLSADWTAFGPEIAVNEVNGSLVMNPADGSAGVRSKDRYNLQSCRIYIEISHLPAHHLHPVEAWFELKGDGDDYLSIYVAEGSLRGQVMVDGNIIQDANVTFEEGDNRFWRFREQNGQTALQYAGDNFQFTNLVVVPTPGFVADTMVELGTHATNTVDNAGIFGVDGVNVGQ